MRKSHFVYLLACCFVNPAFAADNTEDSGDNGQTHSLKKTLEDFLSADEVERSRSLSKFGTGQYFGLGSTYDGSDLLINEPSLHKDLGLLEQNRFMDAHVGKVGDSGARVQLSGNINAAGLYHFSPAPTDEKSAIDATAEIDLAAEVNDYFTGYVKFAGSSDRSNFAFDQGFVVMGNLDDTPWYGTAGKMFVPNGDYGTYMITSPLTRGLGRNKANAAVGGYFDPNASAELFVLQGFTKRSSHDQIDQWGVNADYHPVTCGDGDVTFRFGGSYFNNMADADSIIPIVGTDAEMQHYVDGVNVNSKLGMGPVTLRGEYITALGSFAAVDVGALEDVKPSAMNVEAQYTVPGMAKKTRLIAGYGRTWSAENLGLAEDQYGVSANITVLRNTIVSAEVLRKDPYSGNADHVATVQVDLYF